MYIVKICSNQVMPVRVIQKILFYDKKVCDLSCSCIFVKQEQLLYSWFSGIKMASYYISAYFVVKHAKHTIVYRV